MESLTVGLLIKFSSTWSQSENSAPFDLHPLDKAGLWFSTSKSPDIATIWVLKMTLILSWSWKERISTFGGLEINFRNEFYFTPNTSRILLLHQKSHSVRPIELSYKCNRLLQIQIVNWMELLRNALIEAQRKCFPSDPFLDKNTFTNGNNNDDNDGTMAYNQLFEAPNILFCACLWINKRKHSNSTPNAWCIHFKRSLSQTPSPLWEWDEM